MPPKQQSLIHLLTNDIYEAAARVAPERAAELEPEIRRAADLISFKETGSREIMRAYAGDSTVGINAYIPGLEFLWCSSYVFWRMYQLLRQVQIRSPRLFAPTELEEKELLQASLSDAVLCFEKGQRRSPIEKLWRAATAEDATTVTELFLVAIGWTIHHEFAHIKLKHLTERHYEPTRPVEFEADDFATQWVLPKAVIPAERRKRLLGIVTALGCLTARRADSNRPDEEAEKDHPHSLQRLTRILDRNNVVDEVVCAYAVSTIQSVMTLGRYYYVPTNDETFCAILRDLDGVFRFRADGGFWSIVPEDLARAYFLRLHTPVPHEVIEKLAYAKWQGRGQPIGSPEVDWFAAENLLKDKLRDPNYRSEWVDDVLAFAAELPERLR